MCRRSQRDSRLEPTYFLPPKLERPPKSLGRTVGPPKRRGLPGSGTSARLGPAGKRARTSTEVPGPAPTPVSAPAQNPKPRTRSFPGGSLDAFRESLKQQCARSGSSGFSKEKRITAGVQFIFKDGNINFFETTKRVVVQGVASQNSFHT